jgi:cysteine sulfinate desulfinase/cysteine desulfurase-like protein
MRAARRTGEPRSSDPGSRRTVTLTFASQALACFPAASGNAVLAGAREVAASTGSACHAGMDRASDVILAMDVAPEAAVGTVRLTLGRSTTEADVAHAADALVRSWRTCARPR